MRYLIGPLLLPLLGPLLFVPWILEGCTCWAEGGSSPSGEEPDKMIDQDSETKWLDRYGTALPIGNRQ